jgi:tetratricopeptide (TPR) repeat protein
MARRLQKKRSASASGAPTSSPAPSMAAPSNFAATWKIWLPQVLLIAATTLWIYWPALQGGFVWDDNWYIVDNPLMKKGAGLWKIWFQPGSFTEYYPLTQSVQWLQWQLWGENTLGYHLLNIVLHILNALLVWRLLARFGLKYAWIGGLLFAVHPAQVDSVAWIVELKNTLSLPFFLLAMGFWIDYEDRHWPRDYACALVFFVVAMLGKITMTPFPFVILLYAWWRRGRIGWADLRASVPFFVVSLALGFMTVWADHIYSDSGHDEAAIATSLLARVANAGSILGFYLYRAFVPIDYLPAYPQWTASPSSFFGWLPFLLTTVVACWFWSRRQTWGRHAGLGGGFFVLMLSPFLGFLWLKYMDFTWVMDHFLYLPMIGLIGLGMAALENLEARYPAGQRFLMGGVTVIAALMALESHAFANLFSNDETLWRYTVDRTPDSWLAHNNLGADLVKEGHVEEGIGEYEEVLRLNPGDSDGHYNLGVALEKLGNDQAAQDQYRQAVQLNGREAKNYINLANSLQKTGHRAEAIAQYEKAVQIIPDFAQLHYNLGSLQLQSGNFPAAIEQFGQAVKIDPGLAQARENLGIALVQTGRLPEAVAQFKAAVRIDYGYVIAHDNLALALGQMGRTEEAIEQFQQALQLDPQDQRALEGMAQLQRHATTPAPGKN